jgi:hypothetical protein
MLTTMKKALLTGIAALLLATGTAYAMPYAAYRCGRHQIEMLPGKYHTTGNGCTKGCDGKSHYYAGDNIVDRWIKEGDAPDFVEVGKAGIAVDHAMRR